MFLSRSESMLAFGQLREIVVFPIGPRSTGFDSFTDDSAGDLNKIKGTWRSPK